MAQPAPAAPVAPAAPAAPAPAAQPAAAAPAPPAAAQALARPVVVPGDFTNQSGEDWTTYLAQFEAACAVNGYNPQARSQFLPCLLKGSAFLVYQSVVQANPQIGYAQLLTELTQRFNPPQQSQLLEAEFRARTKIPSETQVQFAAALQKLAMRAFPGQHGTPLFERLVMNQFIDGQPSPDLRLHIRTAAPNGLDAAVRRALEIAAILDTESRRSGQVTSITASPFGGVAACMPSAADRVCATSTSQDASQAKVASSDALMLSLLTKISDRLDALSCSAAPSPMPSESRSVASGQSSRVGSDSSGVSRGSRGPRRCWECGSTDHIRSTCPRRNSSSQSQGRPSGGTSGN